MHNLIAPRLQRFISKLGGMSHTYQLCSVILHTPLKDVEPDAMASPIQGHHRLHTGHYSCIQLESVSSAILHNDDELKRLSGFNVVAEYAGKIVFGFLYEGMHKLYYHY